MYKKSITFSLLFLLACFVTGNVVERSAVITADLTTDATPSSKVPVATATAAPNSHTAAVVKPTPSETFAHDAKLDEDGAYWLFWEANDTHITFETHVKTNGYFGFGLSGNGQMFPGDVVLGWVKDGVTHFKDCHTVGHVMPKEDDSQDWTLLHGEENDMGTVFKFTRKLDTCDDDDLKITDDTIRIIFSYHPDDPLDITSLPWHGRARRGSRSLLLLSATSANVPVPHNVETFSFVKHNYHVTAKGTTYHCSTYRLPELSQKHHIFKYAPYIQKGNEKHVHHIVLYFYDEPIDRQYDNINYDCTMGLNTPKALNTIRVIFLLWAVGGGDYYLPADIGIPLGGVGDPKFFVLETHYDNPTHRTDIVDSSGIIMYYTSELRQHDAGIMYTGMATSPLQIIPPFQKSFVSNGYCAEECIDMNVPDDGVKVFAVFQHAHLLGAAIKTRHFRNGTELEPFADDKHYDFNFQDIRALKNELTLQRGDSVSVQCTYDSSLRANATYGGLSTEEEMCITTLLYYPKTNLTGCTSRPLYETVNANPWKAVETMKTWDWSDPSVRRHFKSILKDSDYHMGCAQQLGYITTGAACGAGDAHTSGTPDYTLGVCEASCHYQKGVQTYVTLPATPRPVPQQLMEHDKWRTHTGSVIRVTTNLFWFISLIPVMFLYLT